MTVESFWQPCNGAKTWKCHRLLFRSSRTLSLQACSATAKPWMVTGHFLDVPIIQSCSNKRWLEWWPLIWLLFLCTESVTVAYQACSHWTWPVLMRVPIRILLQRAASILCAFSATQSKGLWCLWITQSKHCFIIPQLICRLPHCNCLCNLLTLIWNSLRCTNDSRQPCSRGAAYLPETDEALGRDEGGRNNSESAENPTVPRCPRGVF